MERELVCRLNYSEGNRSSECRSEKSPASFAFRAFRPTYLTLPSQHPHLPAAIDSRGGVHTPRQRAIRLQSASNTSSSSLVIGSHKCHEGHEGFWSLLKRGIGGVYHSVSTKYLQSYCDECNFRYNRRNEGQPMFTSLLEQVSERAL